VNELRAFRALTIAAATMTLTVALAGCSAANKGQPAQYRTVAEDLGRDADGAREANAQAVRMIEQRRWPEAEAQLKAALTADVTCGPAHNNLGKVYYHTGRYYLAAWEFKYAAKLMPYQPEPKNNLAMVLESVGKLDEAVAQYDEALALEPENPELIGNTARARVRRGDRDDGVIQLLSQLVLHDTRPRWIEWAKEQLALRRIASETPATTEP
jgi:Flp pilus assembly protein TadD